MILRPFCTLPAVLISLLLLFAPSARADDETPFDCRVTVDGVKFDLTSLAGEHTVNKSRETPPSTIVNSLRFNLCGELKKLEGYTERDQCSSGTRACLTQINVKSDEPDRITSVIPLMRTSRDDLTFKSGLSSPKFISISSKGPEYPHPINSNPTTQSLNLTLFCSPGETSDIKFNSYDGAQLQVEWSTPAGCPFQEEGGGGQHGGDDDAGKGPEDEKNESTGSGIGWFFLVLILAFVAYFGLGAYYNYSTYGARGADLIPHRDFWKEVPYMLSDVVSHLCSSVRPRRSVNRGYIAV
ncbi:Autophagy-related protein 27 [Hypsizygus marmoreus]|uniref:Autophagy-related protein 27 n=1 Tax=Hypsizygus marmoreus TaxID=39966 RepID=A0A369JS17_HYPMA|nr:Autophagy-related protein 27 [Hypsizygus marmoreus]